MPQKSTSPFAATKRFLGELRARGVTVSRRGTLRRPAKYLPAVKLIEVGKASITGRSPVAGVWHEAGYAISTKNDPNVRDALRVRRDAVMSGHRAGKAVSSLALKDAANKAAIAKAGQLGVSKKLQSKFRGYAGAAFKTYQDDAKNAIREAREGTVPAKYRNVLKREFTHRDEMLRRALLTGLQRLNSRLTEFAAGPQARSAATGQFKPGTAVSGRQIQSAYRIGPLMALKPNPVLRRAILAALQK